MNAGRKIHGVYPWHWKNRFSVKQTDAGVISVISLSEAVLGFGSASPGCQLLEMRSCFVLVEHHSPSLGL